MLTAGACARMRADGFDCGEAVVLKATSVAPLGATGKYTAVLSDGTDTLDAVLSTEASKLVESGALASGSTLRLTAYSVSALSGGTKAVVTACDVLPGGGGGGADENVKPAAGVTPGPAARPPPVAGPTPPAAPAAAAAAAATPGAHRPALPIAALNPYTPSWTLRAWVERRGPKRTTAGGLSVFSAELVDEAGDAIEATFWREAADRWDPVLAQGACYFFAKGKVKPASKAYAATRHPYCLDFGVGSTVEAAPPPPGGAASGPGGAGPARTPTARLSYVPIAGLAPHIGRKAPVDVIGFLLAAGPLGSVKRKSDAAELARRDLTVGDASGKSVVLTLWGGAAEGAGAEAEAAAAAAAAAGAGQAGGAPPPPPIISVSHCRVSDFNGVSVSALARSAVALDPPCRAADDLRAWWAAEGAKLGGAAGFAPAGEGLGRAGGAGGGPKPRAVLADLAAKPGEALPPPSAKPEYHTVVATVTMVDPEQTMWYAAAPVDHNRKVVARDGGWWCEYDATLHPSMTRRYVLQAKAGDASGEEAVALFDEAARTLLGASADDLAALREGKDGGGAPADGGRAYAAAVRAAQFSTWVMRVQARTQEYNGELRRRLAVHSLAPMDWGAEAKRLVSAIDGIAAA